jgi:L-threonylcarbamoyladenylate synthase
MKEIFDFSKAILAGKIFIYPTDTIYGLGCNALDEKAVDKLKEIKSREKDKPLSIIAPSINWIKEHCTVDVGLSKYLPGPYTIILKKKDIDFLSHISKDTLGVRIPDCDFTKQIQSANVPFITTSVNLAGEKPAANIDEISDKIKEQVDIIVDAGKLSGKPSTLIINGKEIERD